MLDNLFTHSDLASLARNRFKRAEKLSIAKEFSAKYIDEGWTIEREGERTFRISREKPHSKWLEDRVWSLLYKMQFSFLSGDGGAILSTDHRSPSAPISQMDCIGIDSEVALAIECKSSLAGGRRNQFQEELGKLSLSRKPFSAAVSRKYPQETKRHIGIIFAYSGFTLSDNDKERASQANVLLLDEKDISYYESLVNHIGPAARYQFLADLFPGRIIDGLHVTVPAIKSKIGSKSCYTFSITPEYLLKLSFVSHRAKGKASDVDTYQRLLIKSRLKKIREYISDDGVFPTNIVVNFEPHRLEFNKMAQDEHATGGGVAGWLKIRPAYKTAWIIDGQHRLFAYSGHPRAASSFLSVLAFDGLEPSQQAKMFIDINAEQKKVQPSLLVELFAELHWNSAEPNKQLRAVISKALQRMSEDHDSAFFGRLRLADDESSDIRCITLTTVFEATLKAKLHIVREKDGKVVEFGPLHDTDPMTEVRRTAVVFDAWFGAIRNHATAWWDVGRGDGGGLAMNDSVSACIAVLGSVCVHLHPQKILHLSTQELVVRLRPYAEALAKYLGGLDTQKRKNWRDLRGAQGRDIRMRECQEAIRKEIPEFQPAGLDEFLERSKSQNNAEAKQVITALETNLQEVIVSELKRRFPDDDAWWRNGVPQKIRLDVSTLMENDNDKRGGREHYFNLIHYRKIAADNWDLFRPLFGYKAAGNSKEKQLSWLDFVNEKRNELYHASSGIYIASDELAELRLYLEWFVENRQSAEEDIEEEMAVEA